MYAKNYCITTSRCEHTLKIFDIIVQILVGMTHNQGHMELFGTPQAELAINHTPHGGMMGAVTAEVTHSDL